MMFFYDGNLKDISLLEFENTVTIDAGNGYTDNIRKLYDVITASPHYFVLTNQQALLRNEWLWDEQTHEPRLCFKDERDGKWRPVGRFTKADIKFTHNLEKMFIEGGFSKRSYKRKANRKAREILRFRIDAKEDNDEEEDE